MSFQQQGKIVIPQRPKSPVRIGKVGSTPILLERTDSGLSVVTPFASATVPAETPEAVVAAAKRLARQS